MDKSPRFIVYFGKEDERNAILEPIRHQQSRNLIPGEVTAAIYADSQTRKDIPLHIRCGTPILRKILTENLPEWEDRGWVGVEIGDYVRKLAGELRQRCAITTLSDIKGHTEWKWISTVRTDATDDLEGMQAYSPLAEGTFRLRSRWTM